MWNRDLESQTYKMRRVQLAKKGLTHVEIDSIFEGESVKQIIEESFAKTRESLVEEIGLELKRLHEENRIEFAQKQALLQKINNLLENIKENEEVKKDFKETLEQITQKYEAILKSSVAETEKAKEEVLRHLEVLKEEIKKYRELSAHAIKVHDQYVKELDTVNKLRLELVKATNEYNRKVEAHNRRIRQ